MKKWHLLSGVLVLTIMLSVFSCKKTEENPTPANELDRKPMLENYANNHVVPAYDNMLSVLNELKTAIQAFTGNPDNTTRQAAQSKWLAAYKTWQKTDLLEFGPAENIGLRTYLNTFPATATKIEGNISSGSYNLEEFGSKDAQGFPALDYLLSGLDLDKYTTDGMAAQRKQYMLDVVNKMIEKVQQVKTEWATYKSAFVDNTGTDANSSMSQMVNSFVLYYERYLRGGKVGLPVGAMTGAAKPELVEAYYSPELSKEFIVDALTSVQNFYNGKSYNGGATGESMYSYMKALDTKDDNGVLMADLVNTELQEAITAIKAISGTMKDAVQNDRQTVLKAYDEIQDVVPLFKVDMVSAFSISITYTDNDGD